MDSETLYIYLIIVAGIITGIVLERYLQKRRQQRSLEKREAVQNTNVEKFSSELGSVETKKREDLVDMIRLGESLLEVKEFHRDPKIRRMIENGIDKGKKRLLEDNDS